MKCPTCGSKAVTTVVVTGEHYCRGCRRVWRDGEKPQKVDWRADVHKAKKALKQSAKRIDEGRGVTAETWARKRRHPTD